MEWMIWIGTAITVVGLGGLVWCIIAAVSARRAGLPDDALRARLKTVLTWNLASLALSAIGLMAVVLGIILA